ncbi:hydroxymethylglutaryl-CoA lyase [Seiridium cupressi]
MGSITNTNGISSSADQTKPAQVLSDIRQRYKISHPVSAAVAEGTNNLHLSSVSSLRVTSPLVTKARRVNNRNHNEQSSPYISTRQQLVSYSQHPVAATRGRDVRIIEVGPRDGLQNIKHLVSKETKIELIQRLAETGLRDIETTSFVSPKWVPQLADGHVVMQETLRFAESQGGQTHGYRFPVLTPNMKGLQNAKAAGAKEIVVFASVTEGFSKADQNCTVDEAIRQARAVTKEALSLGIKVRGFISCIFSDPFSGPTAPQDVLRVVQQFLDMGCYEVGLGDTLGVGTPKDTQNLLEVLLRDVPANKLAGHFHDTYGQAIANLYRAYEMGLRTFDSSVAGLGGCPYAPGARGNVATEDVVYTLEQAGVNTGVDLDKLVKVGQWISGQIGTPYGSRAGAALVSKRAQVSLPSSQAKKERASMADSATRRWDVIQDTGEYRVSRAGTAVKITLTRPNNGNAMTGAMLDGLTTLFRSLHEDPLTYHVVLESTGKYFCTGMDLSGGTNTTDMSGDSNYYDRVAALFDAIDQTPQTTIALVNGPCFGGGVGLTFACDVRIVSPEARWTLSEVKIGVSPAVISKFLVREWGVSMAREGMLSGREMAPEELWRVGAIHTIAAKDEPLETKLNNYLDQLQKCAPRSAAVNKELARIAWVAPDTEPHAQLVEKAFHAMMADGGEGQHGIRQFRDKNKRFSWRDFWNTRNPFANVIYGSRDS